MTVTLNGKEYTYKRPVMRLEREAREVVNEFVAVTQEELEHPSEDALANAERVWKRLAALMFVDPSGLEYGNITRGEIEALSSGFFGYAAAKPNLENGKKT